MKIVQQDTLPIEQITGQFSDGSDRVVTIVSRTFTKVVDDAGILHDLEHDHVPTGQEIAAAIGRPIDVVPTSKVALADYMRQPYERWWMWRNISAEAVTRLAPANVRTALATQTDAAWTELIAAAQAWRAAV